MSKGVEAGRAFMRLSIDNTAFRRGLQNASRRMQAFGRSIAGIGAGFAGVGTALLSPLGLAVSAASDTQETFSKFDVVFAGNAKSVKEWSDSLSAAVGRSETETAGFLAGFQDLLVPIGIDPDRAEESSKLLTKLAFDLGSFNNKADSDVVRDLQAALTGSGEVMKKYGVIVSEAAVKQQLLNDGITPKDASEQQKVFARLAIIMAGTTAAQGDAIRTAEGYANSLKGMKAAASDAASEIGKPLLESLAVYLRFITKAIKGVKDFAKENPQLVRSIAAVTAAITAGGFAIVGLGLSIATAGVALGSLAGLAGTIGTVLATIVSPAGLATAAVVGLGAAIVRYTSVGAQAIEFLGGQFGPLLGIIKSTIQSVVNSLSSGNLEAAGRVATAGLNAAFLEVSAKITEVWNGVTSFLAEAWSKAIKGVVDISAEAAKAWVAVTNGLQGSWATAQNFVTKGVLKLQKEITERLTGEPFDISVEIKAADKKLEDLTKKLESEAKKANSAIDSLRDGTIDELNAAQDKRQTAINAQLEEARQAAQDARDELKGLAAATAEASGEQSKTLDVFKEQSQKITAGLKKAGESSQGTFSSQAAGLLFNGLGPQEKKLEEVKQAVDKGTDVQKKIVRAIANNSGLVFGVG